MSGADAEKKGGIMLAQYCRLACLAIGLIHAGYTCAQNAHFTLLGQTHSESTSTGIGCVQHAGGLTSSFGDLTLGTGAARFHVSGVGDSGANAIVLPTQFLCFGAAGTGSDTWTWSAALRLDGVRGTTADVQGTLRSQWFRFLEVLGAGLTEVRIQSQVDFFFEGPNGPIPIRTVVIDRVGSRTALGVEQHDDNAAPVTYFVGGMKVGDPVYGTLHMTGQLKVSATVDYDAFGFGDLAASSVGDFLLDGDITNVEAPPPPAPIPTLSEWALVLMMGMLGIWGAYLVSRRRKPS